MIIQRTRRLRIHPPDQPVGHIARIAVRRAAPLLEIPAAVDDPAVVEPRGAVVCLRELHALLVRAGDRAGQSDAVLRAGHAVGYHAQDLGVRAWDLGLVVRVAAVRTLVVLHEPRVADRPVWTDGCAGAHAPFGFLHDDREDEAVVHAAGMRDGLDRVVQGLRFSGAEVRGVVDSVAGPGDDVLVYGPHIVKAEPLKAWGPAGGGAAIAQVEIVVV